MNDTRLVALKAADCLPFDSTGGTDDSVFIALQSMAQPNVFRFAEDERGKENEPLVTFDWQRRHWRAGRYVGFVRFRHKDETYELSIRPRFGETFLFHMLETIYNVRILPSMSAYQESPDIGSLIRRIISFIWLQRLSASNRHGIPKGAAEVVHKGPMLKGRLNVRRSIIPAYVSGDLISVQRVKAADRTVARIVLSARSELLRSFGLGGLPVSDAARDALLHFAEAEGPIKAVSERDYRSVKLAAIYRDWQPTVDLSWQIVQGRVHQEQAHSPLVGQAFFIDMAEVWELYLRSILRRHFSAEGWTVASPTLKSYPTQYFSRTLIPDIVMTKRDKHAIFDAKYKRMRWDPRDFDRADFFQIHTYIAFLQRSSRIVCGGLLYPLDSECPEPKRQASDQLFGVETDLPSTVFLADGISMADSIEGEDRHAIQTGFKENEQAFLERLGSALETG